MAVDHQGIARKYAEVHSRSLYDSDGDRERALVGIILQAIRESELPDPAERRAPVQRYAERTIPWEIHARAWEAYAAKYGTSQSAERIAQRGGFGVGELDEFYPGWRDRVSDFGRLQREVLRLRTELADAEEGRRAAEERVSALMAPPSTPLERIRGWVDGGFMTNYADLIVDIKALVGEIDRYRAGDGA